MSATGELLDEITAASIDLVALVVDAVKAVADSNLEADTIPAAVDALSRAARSGADVHAGVVAAAEAIRKARAQS